MRVSKQEMDKNHERIVAGAARLIRERGIENTSVADAMGEAGMKHGGFYRHFDTKEALVDAALRAAFDQMISLLEAQFTEREPKDARTAFRNFYISWQHLEQPGTGCPAAANGNDVARGPESLKASFARGIRRVILTLAKGFPGSHREKQNAAAREFAMLVGAVVIARASDTKTARTVLFACRNG